MDVFDKFFVKFGYKFPKGYPDMNNEQDVLLLESTIEQLLPEFSFSSMREPLLLEVNNREINSNTIKDLIHQVNLQCMRWILRSLVW